MTKRPCARAGCGALVERGYCERCRPASPRAVLERERGNANERGYDHVWRRARLNYLALHPVCADTYKLHPLIVKPSTDIDHIIAVSGPADPRFWDQANWQALCHNCHAWKTARVDGGLGLPARR